MAPKMEQHLSSIFGKKRTLQIELEKDDCKKLKKFSKIRRIDELETSVQLKQAEPGLCD